MIGLGLLADKYNDKIEFFQNCNFLVSGRRSAVSNQEPRTKNQDQEPRTKNQEPRTNEFRYKFSSPDSAMFFFHD
jgi:hypothetical protein